MKEYTDASVQQQVPDTEQPGLIKPEETSGGYQYPETRDLVSLVKDAVALVRAKGEEAFTDFRQPGSRWRQADTYIFVLDEGGNMLVHPELEGKNVPDLKDINGKPIIRGLLEAATALPDRPEGWYHYEWTVPGGLFPRWKSSYVQLVKAPSGQDYIVGSGMYNDRMEREFIVDMVTRAVAEIEKSGEAAYELLRDPSGPFRVKDAYIFVMDTEGVELFNPVFTNLQGQNLMDMQDTQGKFVDREILQVQTRGSGWIDHMWPKPGESVSTQVSTYVSAASLNGKRVVVGSGVYLADAPKEILTTKKMTAPELMILVRDAAAQLEQRGEKAYEEFRVKGSRWFSDDTYLFIFSMDGTRLFHAAEPQTEGRNDSQLKDILERPIVKMFQEAIASPQGEGWVHYMWPQPGSLFPAWKSSFVKRVVFPSGGQQFVGCGIYNMQMDQVFIEDIVNRAADLLARQGREAFALLRDKTGPFVFMDTYVFVDTPEGVELVNPAQPSLEGRNLIHMTDAQGKFAARDYIEAALNKGSAWVDYLWYKPGKNDPVQKITYVRKVQHDEETYIIGAGLYGESEAKRTGDIRKLAWKSVDREIMSEHLTRQVIFGEKGTLARLEVQSGTRIARHEHINEEYFMTVTGACKFTFDDGREYIVDPGEVLVIPSGLPHAIEALEDSVFIDFFAPVREDWLQGKDQYLRQ